MESDGMTLLRKSFSVQDLGGLKMCCVMLQRKSIIQGEQLIVN